MEQLPIVKNPSYFEMKKQVKELARRMNVITQNGQFVTNDSNEDRTISFAEESWVISMPDDSQLREDLEACEAEKEVLQAENDALQAEKDAKDPSVPVEESVGSDGPRTTSATHIYDDTNATRILVDTWKYEAWIAAISSSYMIIAFRKTEISRSVPGTPQQSSIELEFPDGSIYTGNNAFYLEHYSSVSSGRFAVGNVYYFRTNLQDAKNYVGDPNENIITVPLFSLTINEIPVGTPDPNYPYVTFASIGGGGAYNNISGATSP